MKLKINKHLNNSFVENLKRVLNESSVKTLKSVQVYYFLGEDEQGNEMLYFSLVKDDNVIYEKQKKIKIIQELLYSEEEEIELINDVIIDIITLGIKFITLDNLKTDPTRLQLEKNLITHVLYLN